jgi:hypothetical protein
MSERYDPYREPYRQAGDRTPEQGTVQHEPDDWREHTTPGMAAVPPPPPSGGPTAAYPAVGRPYAGQAPRPEYPGGPYAGDPYADGAGSMTAPDYTGRSVAVRRPEVLGGLLLVLAGVAAGVSLLLRWVDGSTVTGWDLMRSAWHQLRTAPAGLLDTGLWQPAAAVVGGGLLFVLGLLLFIPARAHRTLGLLALLVSVGAAAGVVVAIQGAHWHVGRFEIGFWFAVAVPALGVIGSLKALFTSPR